MDTNIDIEALRAENAKLRELLGRCAEDLRQHADIDTLTDDSPTRQLYLAARAALENGK